MRARSGYRRLSLLAIALLMSIAGCASSVPAPHARSGEVLFVCEHGNAKSLMAASWFNRVAEQRNLPFKAQARGTAPDSDSVPEGIVAGLRAQGFDVSGFRPAAVSSTDVARADRVITIGLSDQAVSGMPEPKVEPWNDVPAASTDFAASLESLKAHVETLVDQLSGNQH